jgi:hypothetical protein
MKLSVRTIKHQLLAVQGHNSAHSKDLEKKALNYICDLFQITANSWEDYTRLQMKQQPKVPPKECQTTINPGAHLSTFSDEEGKATIKSSKISPPPPLSHHTN